MKFADRMVPERTADRAAAAAGLSSSIGGRQSFFTLPSEEVGINVVPVPVNNTMSYPWLSRILNNIAETIEPNSGMLGFGPGGGLGWTGALFGELAPFEGGLSALARSGAAIAAEESIGAFSVYDTSITMRGSEYVNVRTNLTPQAFRNNLTANGFKTIKQDGNATVLKKGNSTYGIYTRATTGKPGAHYVGPNETEVKFSFGER